MQPSCLLIVQGKERFLLPVERRVFLYSALIGSSAGRVLRSYNFHVRILQQLLWEYAQFEFVLIGELSSLVAIAACCRSIFLADWIRLRSIAQIPRFAFPDFYQLLPTIAQSG